MLNTGLLGTTVELPIYFLCLFGVLLAAYLLGSINSAILISKLIYKEDVRTKGSGNAGMTNMLRTYGKNAALLTLAGDLLKTVIALIIAAIPFGFNYTAGIAIGGPMGECYLAGLFAVLGHIFPLYYKFRGGKGVLVTSTMALVLTPIPFLLLFLLFVVVVWISKYVSLGSVIVATLYPVLINGYFSVRFDGLGMPVLAAISTITLAILIVWCHRANLQRISERKEHKISFGKKK